MTDKVMGEQEGLYLYLSISVLACVCVGGVADEERVTGRTVWVDYFPAYLLGCRLAALRNIWELFSVLSPLSTHFPFHLILLVTTPSFTFDHFSCFPAIFFHFVLPSFLSLKSSSMSVYFILHLPLLLLTFCFLPAPLLPFFLSVCHSLFSLHPNDKEKISMKSFSVPMSSGGGFSWRLYIQIGVNTFSMYAAPQRDS